MIFDVKFSVNSIFDIEEIYEYSVNEFGIAQADTYGKGLESCIILLSKTPNIGLTRLDIKTGLYSLKCQEHIIFYRIFKTHIRIIRLLHASRDYLKILK